MITTDQNRLWDYRIIEKIGQGEYGIVYKVKHKQTDQVFALKKINISNMSQKQKIQAFRQVKTLKKLDHPNIIKYYQSFLSADNLYIVMEYAQKGDLHLAIQKRNMNGQRYKEQELWTLFRILCSAVQHLHQNKIIHRDIKLQNIFITKDGSMKLGDLGLSKILENKTDLASQRVGTPIYFAPELIQHLPYGFGIDVWALGCVFYTLLNFSHPFDGATLQTLAYYILTKGPWPLKNCIYSAHIVKFVFQLLEKNPALRPDIDKAMRGIDLAQTGETVSRVSVYNSRALSSMVYEVDDREKRHQQQNAFSVIGEPLSYRRMRVRNNANRDQSGQSSLLMDDAKQQPNLADLLKNVMSKKIIELDQLTQRRKSCDQLLPNKEQAALDFEALRKSTYIPKTESMIKSNGFSKQKFKIHMLPTRYQSKSPVKNRGLTPRQKYHKSYV